MSHSSRSGVRRAVTVAVVAVGAAAASWGVGAVAAAPQSRTAGATAHAAQSRGADATARCGTSQLRADQVRMEGAAGSVYVTVRFTNVGQTACSLAGYPQVLFFTEDGRPLTTASRRNGGPTPSVVLEPAGTAEFFLRYPNPGVANCRPRSTHRYLVTPPRASLPLLVESGQQLSLCPGTVSRSPVARSV